MRGFWICLFFWMNTWTKEWIIWILSFWFVFIWILSFWFVFYFKWHLSLTIKKKTGVQNPVLISSQWELDGNWIQTIRTEAAKSGRKMWVSESWHRFHRKCKCHNKKKTKKLVHAYDSYSACSAAISRVSLSQLFGFPLIIWNTAHTSHRYLLIFCNSEDVELYFVHLLKNALQLFFKDVLHSGIHFAEYQSTQVQFVWITWPPTPFLLLGCMLWTPITSQTLCNKSELPVYQRTCLALQTPGLMRCSSVITHIIKSKKCPPLTSQVTSPV